MAKNKIEKLLPYSIKCVNNGDPFEMPEWNVKKHRAALVKLGEDQKKYKWDEKESEEQFKYYVIYETMLELDPQCDFEALKHFCRHPMTLTELFNAVYNAGRENIYYLDFRKGKTQKDKK